MTRPVIKSGEMSERLHIRGLAMPPLVAPPTAETLRIAELEGQVSEMRREADALRQEAAALESAIVEARSEALAQGRSDGRKEAEDRTDELLANLKEALGNAAEDFRQAVERLERLSGDLAGLALGRIVGDAGARPGLVADTLRLATTDLFRDSVVVAEVSRADFPDALTLEALRLPQTTPAVEVRINDEMASGACRLRLKLGEADLGLDGQVARLRILLETTAQVG